MNLCPVCGEPIVRKGLKFCGKQCYAKAREKRVPVTCVVCSVEFKIRPFELARSQKHHCPNCRQQWEGRQSANKPLTGYKLSCYNCGRPIYRERWYAHRYLYSFCSKECRRDGWFSLRMAHAGLFGSTKKKGKTTS